MIGQRNKNGFTLIELLIVIAIVAVLAALLFPVFMSAKKAALKSTCISNMKQMGVGLLLYVDDNSGLYPAANQDELPEFTSANFSPKINPACLTHTAVGLIWTLKPYMKSKDFWKCPLGAKWTVNASTYTIPAGVSVSAQDWGMVGWIKGPGIGEVYTNYSAFPLTRHHAPLDHNNVTSSDNREDVFCAMGKSPVQFYEDCKREGYRPILFHDSYANSQYSYVPHDGMGGVYYDGSVKMFMTTKREGNQR